MVWNNLVQPCPILSRGTFQIPPYYKTPLEVFSRTEIYTAVRNSFKPCLPYLHVNITDVSHWHIM